MEYYTLDEIQEILKRGAKILNVKLENSGAEELAKKQRDTKNS